MQKKEFAEVIVKVLHAQESSNIEFFLDFCSKGVFLVR